jgi:hypothetical protein
MEPRRASEISDAIEELIDRVWYDRHMVARYKVQTGKIKMIAKKDYDRCWYARNARLLRVDHDLTEKRPLLQQSLSSRRIRESESVTNDRLELPLRNEIDGRCNIPLRIAG